MTVEKKRRRWGVIAAEILLVVTVFIGINMFQTREAASGAAPELIAETISGEAYQLRKLHEPVIVHFWATWCPVCGLEEGNVERMAGSYPVISVAMSSGSDNEIRRYLDANELSFDVINDDGGEISAAWGVHGVPMTFFVDSEGEIRFKEMGYTTTAGLWLRAWLTGLLSR